MEDKHLTLLVVDFDGKDTATEALKVVKQLKKEKKVVLEDVVAAYKNDKGKVKLVQGKELTAKKGVTRFGAAGLLVGVVLGGPIGGAVVGGIIGKIAAKDKGFDNKAMEEIAEELEDDGSLLFLLVSDYEDGVFVERMEGVGGNVRSFLLAEEGLVALGEISEDEAFLAVLEEKPAEVEVEITEIKAE